VEQLEQVVGLRPLHDGSRGEHGQRVGLDHTEHRHAGARGQVHRAPGHQPVDVDLDLDLVGLGGSLGLGTGLGETCTAAPDAPHPHGLPRETHRGPGVLGRIDHRAPEAHLSRALQHVQLFARAGQLGLRLPQGRRQRAALTGQLSHAHHRIGGRAAGCQPYGQRRDLLGQPLGRGHGQVPPDRSGAIADGVAGRQVGRLGGPALDEQRDRQVGVAGRGRQDAGEVEGCEAFGDIGGGQVCRRPAEQDQCASASLDPACGRDRVRGAAMDTGVGPQGEHEQVIARDALQRVIACHPHDVAVEEGGEVPRSGARVDHAGVGRRVRSEDVANACLHRSPSARRASRNSTTTSAIRGPAAPSHRGGIRCR